MASKAQASPEIYQKWDEMQKKWDYRKKTTLRGTLFPLWDEAYPLIAAVDRATKLCTGRNRKRDEELVAVPRFILKFLTDHALQLIYDHDPVKKKEHQERKEKEMQDCNSLPLVKALLEKEMTVRDLAGKVKVSEVQMWRYIRGEREPSIPLAGTIGSLLGIDWREIVKLCKEGKDNDQSGTAEGAGQDH